MIPRGCAINSELSNWKIDSTLSANGFGSAKATAASHIKFARPECSASATGNPKPNSAPSAWGVT
jgi:hypothetical protein